MDESNPYKRLVRFIGTVGRNVVDDQVFSRATSLAFTSVISLVPLTMVVFSFGGFDQIGIRLFESLGQFLVPEGNDEMIRALNTFTNNARRLGAFGTLLFLVAAVMLLNATENHLNSIFRARARRGLVRRFGMYIAALALISFMFGSGFGPISGMLDAWQRVSSPVQQLMGVILSILGTMTGMMLLFTLLCDAKVRFRNSLVGAFIGALSFQAAKYGFTLWTTRSVRQSVIYGSVVFIPKLLIWLSVAWVVFLIAAEITYAKQIGAGRKTPLKPGTPADETDLGWKLYLTLAEDFRKGHRPPGLKDLAHRISADERQVDILLKRLEKGGLVHQVTQHPVGFLPAVAPADLSASRVFAVITGWNDVDGNTDIGDATRLIRNGIESSLGERSVRSFLTDESRENER